MVKKIYILFLLMVGVSKLAAQQSPVYSQYILNEFIINPSVAGVDGMTTMNISGRKQWFGWDYGPETFSASFSTRILRSPKYIKTSSGENKLKKGASGRVGLGAALIMDRNGAVARTSLNLTYAYHIFIQSSQLSFGLSFLAQQFKIDNELAQFQGYQEGQTDPLQGLIGKSAFIPDAAFGINYSSAHYNAGLSVFQLFQSPIKFGDFEVDYDQLKQIRFYHLSGTYINEFKENPDWQYEPSFILRANENMTMTADLSMRFIYDHSYWAGIAARTTGDFILLTGLKWNRIYFGYSFDYGFNELSRLSNGSHEITLAVKLGDSARRYRYWQRY